MSKTKKIKIFQKIFKIRAPQMPSRSALYIMVNCFLKKPGAFDWQIKLLPADF
jgi:hypothetical protein